MLSFPSSCDVAHRIVQPGRQSRDGDFCDKEELAMDMRS